MNKGISPLVACVLLIAFTITVATIFSFWVRSLILSDNGVAPDETTTIEERPEYYYTTTIPSERTVCKSWKPVYRSKCLKYKEVELKFGSLTLCDWDSERILTSKKLTFRIDSYWKIGEVDELLELTMVCYNNYYVVDCEEVYDELKIKINNNWCADMTILEVLDKCVEWKEKGRVLYYKCNETEEVIE